MTIAYQQASPPAAQHCPDCGTSENTPGLFCANCFHLKGATPNIRAATFIRRLAAFLLEPVLFFLTLGIGYIIWWLIVLADGQTPGKQLVGIRAVRADGRPLGWGMTFVREFVIKFLIIGTLSGFLFGIVFFVNYLLPLFDKDLQTIHDKVVSSVVVRLDHTPTRRAQIDTSGDPWGGQIDR